MLSMMAIQAVCLAIVINAELLRNKQETTTLDYCARSRDCIMILPEDPSLFKAPPKPLELWRDQYKKSREMWLFILHRNASSDRLNQLAIELAEEHNFFIVESDGMGYFNGQYVLVYNLNQMESNTSDYEDRKRELVDKLRAHPGVMELTSARRYFDRRKDMFWYFRENILAPRIERLKAPQPCYIKMQAMWLLILDLDFFDSKQDLDQFAKHLAHEHNFDFYGKFESVSHVGQYILKINNTNVCASPDNEIHQVDLIGKLSSHPAVKVLRHERRAFRNNYMRFRFIEYYDSFEVMNMKAMADHLASLKSGNHSMWFLDIDINKFSDGRKVNTEFVRQLARTYNFYLIDTIYSYSKNEFILEINVSQSDDLHDMAKKQLDLIEKFRSLRGVTWLGREHDVFRTHFKQIQDFYSQTSLQEMRARWAEKMENVARKQLERGPKFDCGLADDQLMMYTLGVCGLRGLGCSQIIP